MNLKEQGSLDMMVTPQIASDWMQRNISNNRRINQRRVESIADDIRNGRWRFNGNPIRFDADGRLFDGQHRLMAIVAAGRPVLCNVRTGMDPSVITTIDRRSNSRSIAQVLAMMGERNTSALAGAARILVWHGIAPEMVRAGKGGQVVGDDAIVAEIDDVLRRCAAWIDARWALGLPSHMTALMCLVARAWGWDTAESFMDITNKGLGFWGNYDPAYLFRAAMLDRQLDRKNKVADWYIWAIGVKAFNAWKERRDIRTLRVRLDGSRPENWPILCVPSTNRMLAVVTNG